MAKVLFEITEDQLETGLRGYPCGYCTTSFVDPYEGLLYRGHPVSELIYKRPEEVMSLLYAGEEIEKQEVFRQEIKKRAFLSKKTITAIEALPKEGHPMKFFSAALLILGMLEGVGDYREDCLNVIAKIPYLAAICINTHANWGKTAILKPELGYMESFTDLLCIPEGQKKELEEVFKMFNILHYDHGGGNLSAFVGKAVASGLEDMYGSLAATLCALAGPRHGKANQDSLLFAEEVLQQVGENATEKDIEVFLQKKVGMGELLFGFGHAVLKVEDPRATVLYQYAQEKYPHHPLVKIAGLLRKMAPKVLRSNPKVSCPYPNIDAISGILLTAAGFGYPKNFTLLFGLARCVGVSIQIVYERLEARGGKGTPIVRPKYIYKAKA